MEWISGIIGVFVGYGLGEFSRWRRGLSRVKSLKVLIADELIAIKQQIPQKRDILEKMIVAIADKQILGGSSVSFLNVGYRTYFFEINEHLTPKQRNCIHVIHERLNNLDRVLFSFEDEFRFALKDSAVNDPYYAFTARLKDCLDSLIVVNKLIESYLSGEPVDVFYIEQPLVANKRFS